MLSKKAYCSDKHVLLQQKTEKPEREQDVAKETDKL